MKVFKCNRQSHLFEQRTARVSAWQWLYSPTVESGCTNIMTFMSNSCNSEISRMGPRAGYGKIREMTDGIPTVLHGVIDDPICSGICVSSLNGPLKRTLIKEDCNDFLPRLWFSVLPTKSAHQTSVKNRIISKDFNLVECCCWRDHNSGGVWSSC